MGFDRGLGNGQMACDVLVAGAGSDLAQDLALARRELFERVGGGAAAGGMGAGGCWVCKALTSLSVISMLTVDWPRSARSMAATMTSLSPVLSR